MEQSSVGHEEGESLGAFENLVTKVMKDMSSLECRLVERIKTLETTILSNLSASTPNIADPRLGSEVEYLISRDLEDTYKVLESLIHEALTQVKSLEGNDSMDARQMAKHIQEKMAGVTTKLEQVSTLVRVLNCDGPGLLHQCRERSNGSRSNFGKISPPTGCGDVIGKTPLGMTFPGNSQNKTSSFLLERSFLCGSSFFSSQTDLGFEARDSGLGEDLSFKKDVGKLLRFINSNSMVDLRRYVLSHNGGYPIGRPGFETKVRMSDLCPETTPSDGSSSSSEVTLDTLVPCPHGNEIENYYCEPRAHAEDDCQVNRKTPLETSFPLQTTPCGGYDVTGSHERLHIDSVHTTDRSRLDPAAYQICQSSLIAASCANIVDTAEAKESYFVPPSTVGGSVKQQHKRTHSFNVSSYFYTPKKHSKISFNTFTNDRPNSTFFEPTGGTSSFEVTESTSTPITSSSPSTTKTNTPCLSPFAAQTHFPSHCTTSACSLNQSNFRRAKSEQTVKSSERVKWRERSSDTSSKEEEKLAQERLNNDFRSCAAWRPKRKTVIVVNPAEESSRLTSGCVLANQEFDDPKFFNSHELPYIDHSPLILSDNEEDSFADAPKSSVDAAYVNIQSLNGEVTRSTSDGSKVKEGQETLTGLVWPSPGVTSQVTYRKNAAKLRSRWDGFRRAFSMVFEKGSSNNSNGNNNNNLSSCMVRKASSTNFLDTKGSVEGKRTRSNWEVWKKQSRANLSESFRRKCGWLRMTLRRKKKSKGHEDQQQQHQEEEESDVNTSPQRVGPRDETFDPEKTQVVMKSTLASVTDELLRTENDYVSAMKYVIDNYLPLLNYNGPTGETGDNHAGDISCPVELPEQLRGKRYIIFGNLEKIHDFHSKRFQESLRMCKGHPYALGSAFLRHEAEFELYSLYSKNKPKSDQLMEDWGRKFFQMKQAELMDPMNLESYLLKPIQRLSKYALMLKKILQSCPLERAEYTELEAALEMVRFQLRHGEDLLAADCISGCDVNLQEQGMLIRREDLLVTKGLRKCQRHVFLFEELVLFSKTKKRPGGQDTYVYKQSLKTTDIGLTASVGEDGKQFEIWFRKRTPENSYRIQATSRDSKDKWTTDITALLWGQTQKCRQRANANVVMATGLGGRVGVMHFDSNCSRPVSFASSSSSSSSNNSMDQKSIQLRHTSSMSSSSSSSAYTHCSSLDSSNSSHARPLTFQQSTNQGEGSSSTTRPLNFNPKTQSKTCLLQPFSPIGVSKLSPVKEQLT